MTRKQIILIFVAVVLLIAASATSYKLIKSDPNDSQSSAVHPAPPNPGKDAETDLEKSQEVTKTGTFDCLTPQGDGPHTMECAFGLKLDDGTVYALGSDDPMKIGSIPTGTRVTVIGPLQKVPNEKYGTAGTIEVHEIKQL